MARGGVWRAVDLLQNEVRRIILLLQDVEADDTRLLDAVPGILEGGGPEVGEGLGLHLDVDVDDEHRCAVLVTVRGSGETISR